MGLMAGRPPVSVTVAVLPSVCLRVSAVPEPVSMWACLSALLNACASECAACVHACSPGCLPLPVWSAGQVWWLWFRSPQGAEIRTEDRLLRQGTRRAG